MAIDTVTADDVIGTVSNNAKEVLRVARTVYNGYPLVDVRTWTKDVHERPGNPTKKGLSLSPRQWLELLSLIEEAVGCGAPAGEAPDE